MDYEKAYKEALERAKSLIDREGLTEGSYPNRNACEAIFPELAESEDERIRKEILDFIQLCLSRTDFGSRSIALRKEDAEMFKKWIAYLEKQKELSTKKTPAWMPKFLDELRSKNHYFDWDEHRDIEGSILAIIDFIAPDYFTEKDKKEQKPSDNNVYPRSLEEAVRLYYDTYGNGKGGFDYISLPKFQDIVETFVKDYGQKPAEWSEDSVKYEEGFKAGRESGLRDGQKYVLNNLDSYGLCKPTEWSEEDEERIQSILFSVGYCKEEYPNKKDYSKDINWLKFLRPQPHWKPSEEQMEALLSQLPVIKGSGDAIQKILESLYNDLKKL